MREINFVFSAGYRCNSVQFLRRFGLSKFSGPFDWMYIDLESVFQNIQNKFEYYLDDIVIINKEEKKLTNLYNKNFETIKKDLLDLYDCEIKYMNENYFKTTLPINQNYTFAKTPDLYEWDKICIFLHHHLDKQDDFEKIKIRIDRFNEVLKNDSDKAMLFYVSKIIESTNIEEEINKIYFLVKKYNILTNFVCIICSPNSEDYFKKIDNCFFIIKKVPEYSYQFNTYKTDNNFEWLEYGMQGINFEKEYEIIKNNFDLTKLINKEEI